MVFLPKGRQGRKIQRVSINKTFSIPKGLFSVSSLIPSENRNPFVWKVQEFFSFLILSECIRGFNFSLSWKKIRVNSWGNCFLKIQGLGRFGGNGYSKRLFALRSFLGLVNWNQYLYILRDRFAWTTKSVCLQTIPWKQKRLSKFWACSAIQYFHFLNSADVSQAFRLVASNSFHWNLHEQEAYQSFKRLVFKHIHYRNIVLILLILEIEMVFLPKGRQRRKIQRVSINKTFSIPKGLFFCFQPHSKWESKSFRLKSSRIFLIFNSFRMHQRF